MEELLGYFISDHKPDIYAASFSRRGDLLSQWRGYAPNGGLSFGIELDRLKSIDDDRFYHVEECIYDDVKSHLKSKIKARELVQVILDKATYLKTGQIPDHSEGVEISNNKMARLRELDSEIAKNIFKLYALSASIKDNSFSEEQEVRIISHLLGEREVCFRATDKLLIPYTSFGIEDIEIKKIYVSPGIDFELNYNSIVKYFMINGRPVPDICPSSSSYRG
ncbi:DUF2971 domain-containing protein [Reinekea marinisedimentorum]|nr:DUF2971 domain-containing protein [Reinekea marinisedimentorum]